MSTTTQQVTILNRLGLLLRQYHHTDKSTAELVQKTRSQISTKTTTKIAPPKRAKPQDRFNYYHFFALTNAKFCVIETSRSVCSLLTRLIISNSQTYLRNSTSDENVHLRKLYYQSNSPREGKKRAKNTESHLPLAYNCILKK